MSGQSERKAFDQWWKESGYVHGWVASWLAWRGRALLDNPDAMDCGLCQGMGSIYPSIDPQYEEVCTDCRGRGYIE